MKKQKYKTKTAIPSLTAEQNRQRIKELDGMNLSDGSDDPFSARMNNHDTMGIKMPKGLIGTSINGRR